MTSYSNALAMARFSLVEALAKVNRALEFEDETTGLPMINRWDEASLVNGLQSIIRFFREREAELPKTEESEDEE
jgi:hypothetical protein